MRTRRYSVVFVVLVALALLAGAPAALALPVIDAGPGLQPLGFLQSSAENPSTGDFYGVSVAYSGGVSVVGAPVRGTWTGAAYINTHSGELMLQQLLTLDDGAPMDMLGASVAVSGDTVVVSAPGRTVGANEGQGAVYVYGLSGGSWVRQATLTASDGAAGDLFGYAVALEGDTLVVSARQRAVDGIENAGAVYVFTRSGGAWTQSAELTAPHPVSDGWFGQAVCLDGGTLGVGSPGEDGYDGVAYVFTGSGASWSQQARLTTPVVTDGEFGGALDVDGDTLLVSSAFKGSNGVFVFTRTGSAWDSGAELTAPGVVDGDGFGSGVALSGDVAVVGAPARNVDDAENAGSVYTFTKQGGVWGSPTRISSPNGVADGHFGEAVDLADNTLAVGAPGEGLPGTPFCGTAYLGVPSVGPSVRKTGGGPGWHRRPVTLRFSATPSDLGAPVGATQYWVNGVSHSWTDAASLRVTAQGVTRVRYRAVDVNGTPGSVGAIAVRIDSRRPRVVAGAATASGRAVTRLSYSVSDPVPGCGHALVRLVVSDARGRVLTRSSTLPVTTNASHTVRVRTAGLAPGTYRVEWRAVDSAGNRQRGVTVTTLTVR
jgi:hypothetical protein